jgi:NADPH-dependent 2,4-dienoyl-CoA reductase/sulfur reductase-like enzyme
VGREGTVVVAGASLAGVHAALGLRKEGFEGRLALVGAERHRPYDRPPLSKRFLLTGDVATVELPVADELDGLGVEWHLGVAATGLDLGRRAVALSDGRELAFDGLVVATGCAARQLPGAAALVGVHTLRDLDDAGALVAALDARPGRVVVVGAGFIGLEVASTCRGRGLDVTVVDVAGAPIEHVLGAELGGVLAAVHRDHGVDLRLGTGVAGVDAAPDGTGGERVQRVRLTDGTAVDADVVVVGIGVRPATEWLAGTGLALDDGVVCDATGLAAPGVVAAGDVARWPNALFDGELMRIEHWEHAVEMGGHVARTLLAGPGAAEPFAPVPWFWSDQYDRKLQLAGRPRPTDRVRIVAGSLDERRFAALYEREGRVVGVLGMNRPRQVVLGRALVARRATAEEAAGALAG